jgi:N-acetylated-alpha-linked acidic dipeptidase
MKNTILFFCCCFVFNAVLNAQSTAISGFTNAAVQPQLSTEKQFDQHLSAANIGNTIKQLSSRPHHIGSAGGKAVADTIYNRFKSYGWDVRIDTYHVLFPTPKTRLLEMTAPSTYKALLKEPALKEDATSNQQDQLPTYNAWSADGDVTAGLIFVNYGLPEDYEMLDRLGVSVKGKIVIAKYGRSWRGIKPKVAQEHGAIGCLIYSDPADDGYFSGDTYPKGSFKNEYGVQRGSVMDMPVYPGDPLTPNVAATTNAQRIERSKAANLLKIPVLPISYHDAQPFLRALGGPAVPELWHGGLPFTYHIGDGKTQVHLKLAFNWDIVPCYDVIATIRGSQYPDEWVVRGNHHDAWVNGANDPISGVSAELEEAKSIGDMLNAGWHPKRTLVYCAWDGEEPALLGSTEWVEDHLKELQQKAVVYINSDDNARGFLSAGGSHALQQMVNEVAATVTDPQTGVSVLKRRLAKEAADAPTLKAKRDALSKKEMELSALGSGSDFTPFLQYAGIPSLNLGYGGEDAGGEYHSIYDSYDYYRRFKDPSFKYGIALAQTAGHIVLRMADAPQIPFDYKDFYKAVNEYTNQVIALANDLRESTALETQLLTDSIYILAADTAKHLQLQQPKAAVPFFDFAPLQNAVAALQKTTDSLHDALRKTDKSAASDALNKALYQAEQQLLLPQGLPRRPWYKHAIYAPGLYTGYGVKTLPGIREAIEQRNWTEAQTQIQLAADAINRLNKYLQQVRG